MKNKFLYNFDYSLLFFLLLFFIISITTIHSSLLYISSDLGRIDIKQTFYYIFGFIILYFIFKIKNDFFYKYIYLFYIIGNILLLGLLFFGKSINGSKCWYLIPYVGSVQISEFMKIILILFFSKIVYTFYYKERSIRDEFFFLIKISFFLFIPSILTFLEPDTGSVIMYFLLFFIILFFSPLRKRWFVLFFLFFLIAISLIAYSYFFNSDLFIDIFGTNLFYRVYRIFDWHNKTGMQLENSLISIGSSGLYGHGYMNTPLYFPEAATDFIFSIYASNFGFMGCLYLFIILFLFDVHLLITSIRVKNSFYKLVIISTVSIFLYQQIENISMTIGLLPITGITLPFISYGGSSLISNFIIIGIILNISKEKHRFYI